METPAVPTSIRATTAARVAAGDGLPTTMVEVGGEQWSIKPDSGARYSVVGTDWMLRGERLQEAAPVDAVEGIGGFVLDVIGVWSVQMRNAFGQIVEIRACIINRCTEEFLVGVDFLEKHRASLDFNSNEVSYVVHNRWVIIPFRTEGGDGAKVASVRLVKRYSWGAAQ
ncbi:hypothetical protein PF005_g533 [Phytophthora fragariae]|nr:hypothetical protein PF011_g17682 [Phytophthora fragariae]KAE9140796.1 hypothetical protein PF007_g542 [Phytophthora fragariae]KAE9155734.1 hypothetical protein PF006_g373 [Phytophthora fragariae]KAE9237752.1 hypothetical protein PF005_g533 [Phytophthora fragariae]